MENIEIQGMSRGAFLVRGALATGAAYGAASITPWVTRALAQEGGGDVEILNFALTLEYLEADFYTQASKLGLKGEYKALAKDFGANEQAHVDALIATINKLGGKPVKSPQFAFGMKSQKDFEKLAVTLEDTGVSAYNGAAPMIKSSGGARGRRLRSCRSRRATPRRCASSAAWTRRRARSTSRWTRPRC